MAFELMDSDNNGGIERSELKKVFENTEQKDEELWNRIFEEVDVDKDGSISYQEFITNILTK